MCVCGGGGGFTNCLSQHGALTEISSKSVCECVWGGGEGGRGEGGREDGELVQ